MANTSLPRQYARTRRFMLGIPHGFSIAPDGGRVAFLRSGSGDDLVTCLWVLDLATGTERLIADPATLMRDGGGELPLAERTCRDRTRELATGVTGYDTDRAVRRATFALAGHLWVADLATGDARELPAAAPVAAAQLDPAGQAVAYVAGGALRIIGADGSGDRELAAPEHPGVSYGLPERVAAEWGRNRGYWWSPDGRRILVARADTTPVQRWYITDPSDPGRQPTAMAYPAVGTPNADVTLWVIDLDGKRVAVSWDRAGFEYVVAARWGRELVIAVQSRDQKTMRVLAADPHTGVTRMRREDADPCWVHIVPGVPAFTGSGRAIGYSGIRASATSRVAWRSRAAPISALTACT